MTKFRVRTDKDESTPLLTIDQAQNVFESWRDDYIGDGVVADESYVEIVESEDDFENDKVVRRVIAVIDHARTNRRPPRKDGIDWDYWAKWEEVEVEEVHPQ